MKLGLQCLREWRAVLKYVPSWGISMVCHSEMLKNVHFWNMFQTGTVLTFSYIHFSNDWQWVKQTCNKFALDLTKVSTVPRNLFPRNSHFSQWHIVSAVSGRRGTHTYDRLAVTQTILKAKEVVCAIFYTVSNSADIVLLLTLLSLNHLNGI